MKVAMLGASGRAGSEITKELARRGHVVLAVDTNPDTVLTAPGVTPVKGDAFDAAALSKLIEGCDVVISALRFDVPAATLLAAAKQAGIGRVLFTGGAGSLEVAPGVRLIDAPGFPDEARPFVQGGITFLEDLKGDTEIDWIFFSPAADFFAGPRLGHYRLGGNTLVTDEAGVSKISFADYAIAMVDELEQHKHSRERFTAAY
ncbi:NAD(P)H-binding protein [Devosia sp. MC1541]|uniref:NAD(P)-dependent oxidoreductase n=1 Tax=Devosia sp. MC1541 TaxID=2725264 RepID=UPI00145E1472|nr:NAD(P)H-binding protein [Devosia sp. MC1541]